MEYVQLPQTYQLDILDAALTTPLGTNHVRLFSGSPTAGMGTTYADLAAAEVSATWYSSQALTYANPITDSTTNGQLDVIANSVEYRYGAGSGSDASITVTGYFITGPSNALVGYVVLSSPKTMASTYDGFTIQPCISFPPQAV